MAIYIPSFDKKKYEKEKLLPTNTANDTTQKSKISLKSFQRT